MHEISEGNILELRNLISYRNKITQQQMAAIMNEMNEIISSYGAVKTGNPISTTFSVENNLSQPMMDIEILIPLNKTIPVPSGYSFKPIFRLNNAVKVRHTGNPATLQQSADELMKYISEKKLMPITSGYNVNLNEESKVDIENFSMDIYVGVCDNIL